MCLFCEENDFFFVEKAIEQFWSTLPYGTNWTLSRSSALKESNESPDFYERDKAFDGNIETAWVEDGSGSGINEYIMEYVCHRDLDNFNYQLSKRKNGINISIVINNGYCKNENLFLKNNRVKKAKIILYDTPISVGQNSTKIKDKPIIIYENIIELKDTMDEQKFSFIINTRDDNLFSSPFIMIQLIILDVYPGAQLQTGFDYGEINLEDDFTLDYDLIADVTIGSKLIVPEGLDVTIYGDVSSDSYNYGDYLYVFGKLTANFLTRQKIDPQACDSLSASLGQFVGGPGTSQQFEDSQIRHFHNVAMTYVLGDHLLGGFQHGKGMNQRDAILVAHTVQELLLANVVAMIHAGVVTQLTAAIGGLNYSFGYFDFRFHFF